MGQVIALSVVAGPIGAPEKLHETHVLEGFDSGEPALDEWIVRRARGNQKRGASNTYVVCEHDVVVGYYCLSTGAVAHADAVSPLRRNMPDPIPTLLLGRLAVRKERAGQGIGSCLLQDAILRTAQAADIAGVAALLVHALHEQAARFYVDRGFHPSPTGPLTLMLSLREIWANLPK